MLSKVFRGAPIYSLLFDPENPTTTSPLEFTGYRASDGASPARLNLVQSGRNYFDGEDWGHYTYTTLDPSDSTSFWTIQQYSETPPGTEAVVGYKRYGTWITKTKRQ